jgi:hypothetical protein
MGEDRGGNPAPAGGMTRVEVADSLGVSVATVRRLEGKTLHPTRASDGHWCFDPREVESVRPAMAHAGKAAAPGKPTGRGPADGELAAKLFPLFERGASFDAVVRETHASPTAIRALFREWRLGYSQPAEAASSDDLEGEPPSVEVDDEAFAAWEAEVRALDREQARIDRLARRSRGRRPRHF